MMSSGCIGGRCLDVQAPAKACTQKLYRWAESDAEFLKLITEKESSPFPRSPNLRQSQLCRQKFLRSYTFSRKESLAARTRKWLLQKKELKRDGLAGVVKGVKDRSARASCFVLGAVIKCLFSCMVRVDVVEH